MKNVCHICNGSRIFGGVVCVNCDGDGDGKGYTEEMPSAEENARAEALAARIKKLEDGAAVNCERHRQLPENTPEEKLRKWQNLEMEILRRDAFIATEEWLHELDMPREQILECLCTLAGDFLITAFEMMEDVHPTIKAQFFQRFVGVTAQNLIDRQLLPATPPKPHLEKAAPRPQMSSVLGPDGKPIKMRTLN